MAEGLSSVAGYLQTDADQSSATTQYYSYQTGNGAYYILQVITTAGVISYRYFAGSTKYATDWANRAALSYGLYSAIFSNV